MPPFHPLSLQEFADLLARFPFQRQINAVHLHHTWRPNHAQDRGLKSIEGMWQYHTQVNGWSDIAQHLTVSSDGTIWTGRSWTQPPASAAGHNGNRDIGPFMIEMIGDFDQGHDRFEGQQREVALEVIARIQLRFNLPVESLRFHNQMSRKSCPGTSLQYEEVLNAVREVRSRLQATDQARELTDLPFPAAALAYRQHTDAVIQAMSRELPSKAEPWDAEPDLRSAKESDLAILTGLENPTESVSGARSATQQNGARNLDLSPEVLNELRPHVINLVQGEFRDTGVFATSKGDVDAIFEDYLPRELAAAKERGQKLKVLFYAHGGLTAEENALRTAHTQLAWWRENHIYPIYFVWQTGLLETIGQLLQMAAQRFLSKEPAMRDIARDIPDFTTDPVIQEVVRNLGCVQIWSGMKLSAERAFQPDRGGSYLVKKLQEFCQNHPELESIELHGVGHSAGAIFQSHLIAAARQAGIPSFKTMHFLAPAIRIDAFKELLLKPGLIGSGQGIDHLTIFTMKKDWEQADQCAGVYRKSLLYLIYHALEPQRKTEILGLEEFLRADVEMKSLFGLAGIPSPKGEVIWSKSILKTGPNASTCTEHGRFPADAPTMNSVLLRIVGATDNGAIIEFPAAAARDLEVVNFEQLPTGLEAAVSAPMNGAIAPPPLPILPAPVPPIAAPVIAAPPQNGQVGKRLALCVGIDTYPSPYELLGCVADATLWATVLDRLGFSTTQLHNQQATRSAILDGLNTLVRSSQAGDVIAFQFSGHGIQLPDMNADESEGDSPHLDEAICPYDFASGSFVIDDDIGAIFSTIPTGVNVTCFIDCCHSGTISRFAVGASPQRQADTRVERVRFMKATESLIEAHRRFRERVGRSRSVSNGGIDLMKEVVFSACLSIEQAFENNGQGDFTRYATQLLQQGIQGLSHEDFERQVIAAFGAAPRQHPRLYCNPTVRNGLLLQPIALSPASRSVSPGTAHADSDTAAIAQGFRLIADLLEKR
ncbi:caspase family protein (plasmid) [Kovacikia minuta CCNUW1]|uniref:caspase family protein n=1 Tax=Kovacikia minuta TaxID=2931930 RepID=UPI001CCD0765|nr:caspase family protein [Kovacikia minuta]UBF30356.1 caspase family protein [Kovacikia minuta CCNUW1]